MPPPGENSLEERTEQATPFRREEFRKAGQVAQSKELLSVLLFLTVGTTLYFVMGHIYEEATQIVTRFLSFKKEATFSKTAYLEMGVEVLKSWLWMVFPVFLVSVIVGILASLAQIGVYFTTQPLAPNWERLNPISGFQRLFSLKGSVEALKAAIKVGVSLTILWFFLKARMFEAGTFLGQDTSEVFAYTLVTVFKLLLTLVVALAVMAALDFVFQKYQLEKQMKMTRREAKEEFKLREGDPLIKSRIRSIQRRIASRRMMEEVPKADVVVTNPTHFAVAIKYDAESMMAPKVTAKGQGHIALKIRSLAQSMGVPVVENKPLARSLYKEIEVGHYVPRELYKAVAEVLAYVYRLRNAQVAYA